MCVCVCVCVHSPAQTHSHVPVCASVYTPHTQAPVPELWSNRIMNSMCRGSVRTDGVCLCAYVQGSSGG